jgi:hypothetical protein
MFRFYSRLSLPAKVGLVAALLRILLELAMVVPDYVAYLQHGSETDPFDMRSITLALRALLLAEWPLLFLARPGSIAVHALFPNKVLLQYMLKDCIYILIAGLYWFAIGYFAVIYLRNRVNRPTLSLRLIVIASAGALVVLLLTNGRAPLRWFILSAFVHASVFLGLLGFGQWIRRRSRAPVPV